jgi:uracil-DNA glycosylase
VLLLNTSLTVEAGKANSHRKAGWQELAAEVMAFLNAQPGPVVFMLWGKQAQEAGKAIDRNRHCVIETAHPSPLAHGRGPEHRFVAAQPFRQAADWLQQRNLPAIDWQLPCRPTARLTAGVIDKAGSYRIGKRVRPCQTRHNIKSLSTW